MFFAGVVSAVILVLGSVSVLVHRWIDPACPGCRRKDWTDVPKGIVCRACGWSNLPARAERDEAIAA